MALVAQPAPPPTGKVYTVQDRRDGRVYGLRHERTALVAFRSYQDAFTVSRALEHHHNEHGQFPQHDLEGHPRALEELLPAPLSFRKPRFLRTRAWAGADRLMDVCRANGLDFLYCRQVLTRRHIAYSGELFLTAEATFLAGALNKKLLEGQFGIAEAGKEDQDADAGGDGFLQ